MTKKIKLIKFIIFGLLIVGSFSLIAVSCDNKPKTNNYFEFNFTKQNLNDAKNDNFNFPFRKIDFHDKTFYNDLSSYYNIITSSTAEPTPVPENE
jgi:hypothetical protein